ncbi:MAG: RNA polymerase-binding protein DksA [Proteobacteria bacterium]|nr:RNA polymerase-binding protein DksA [Pseudomonadota bacterium]
MASRKPAPKKSAPKKKVAAKKAPAKKAAVKKATAKKASVKKAVAKKAPAKKAASKKAPAKKTAAKKAPVKKAAAKKPPTKKATPKKAPVKKTAVKKAPAKKAPAKKAPVKKAVTKTAPAKKSATKKSPAKLARAVGQIQKFDDFKPYKPGRGESYMNDEQLEHFRGILLNWRGELVDEVTRTVSHMKDEAANFPDPADRATQEEEFSLELRTRDRERKLIKKIDSTLDRLKNDDYGYCDACGIEIGIQRLEARPTATLCIDCKTLAEIKERQELG